MQMGFFHHNNLDSEPTIQLLRLCSNALITGIMGQTTFIVLIDLKKHVALLIMTFSVKTSSFMEFKIGSLNGSNHTWLVGSILLELMGWIQK